MNQAQRTRCRMWNGKAVAVCMLGLGVLHADAAMLGRAAMTVRDTANLALPATHDNDLASGVLVQSTQATVRVVVDLGEPTTVHRVFLTAAKSALETNTNRPAISPARTLTASVRIATNATSTGVLLASREIGSVTGREIRVSANLRFKPATGRYLRLELARGDLPHGWNVGEIEVYGWTGDRSAHRGDAVVVATNAPAPLRLTADELSYYLGEIAGNPIPVIAPNQTNQYPGTIYRIVDLKPLANSYTQMTNNLANGTLPSIPVNVLREGREVVFRAWPYRNVLWSVWEFLDRQGVKWVYPGAHGDHVPTDRGILPDVAPLQYTPSTEFIYANFGVEYLRNDPDAFLHFWRNRWSHTWGGHQRDTFGGEEVPKKPYPNVTIHPDHVEGLAGYPHNFNNVLPPRILEQNMDWCGILTNSRWASWVGEANFNRRALPRDNQSTFDLTHPGPRQFIINKLIAYWPEHAKYHGTLVWMLPEDSTLFSEDEQSVALRQPLVEDYEPYAMPYPWAVSGDYYDFIRAIAEGIQNAIPEAIVGAMAYSNTHLPPTNHPPLPDNVLVDICLYGARNLPMTSPKNAEMRKRLNDWRGLATHLRHYDYDLIHSESGALKMPVPLVSAFADRAKFYHELDMLDGGTQADLDTIPYNPWNYYAYPRFHWNVELDAATVIDEFFTGYFKEAAGPMKNYYTTLERYLIANNVSLQARGYDYGLRVGAYPIAVLRKMHQHLLAAEALVTSWVTRERILRIREGLDWILERRELMYEDLVDTSIFPRVTPTQGVTIDLRFAAIQTAGQDVGDAWFMFSWAQVGDYVTIEQPGRYRVTIRAGIGYSKSEPGNRQMLFHIGGIQYGPFMIDHETVETYTLLVEIPAGLYEIAVEDLYNRGPFKVASIAIERDNPDPIVPFALRGTSSSQYTYDFASTDNPAALIDSDWDGTSDLLETFAGTDILDDACFFAARGLKPGPNGPLVTWSSVPGKSYALYRADALGGALHLVADNIAATPPENAYADALAGTGNGFYHIAVR
ncbi:MAG TPA: DUF4838 domain-containing protein [Kiritimatiellia bacterium]|nr:DUF4838 domain-containing protein [Kiritimatiellia bacterium]